MSATTRPLGFRLAESAFVATTLTATLFAVARMLWLLRVLPG